MAEEDFRQQAIMKFLIEEGKISKGDIHFILGIRDWLDFVMFVVSMRRNGIVKTEEFVEIGERFGWTREQVKASLKRLQIPTIEGCRPIIEKYSPKGYYNNGLKGKLISLFSKRQELDDGEEYYRSPYFGITVIVGEKDGIMLKLGDLILD